MSKSIIEPNLVAITSPAMDNNSYLIFNGNEAIIVDPSFSGDEIIKTINKDTKPIAILLTHAHFDHCFDVGKILKQWNIPVYLHVDEKSTYKDYRYDDLANMKVLDFSKNIHWFNTKVLNIGSFKIDVLHTPGHSSGSVIYKYKNWVFVGDTLFYNSYGRTDLGNSNPIAMIKSLNTLWAKLNEENLILPGHNRWGLFKDIKHTNLLVKEIIKK